MALLDFFKKKSFPEEKIKEKERKELKKTGAEKKVAEKKVAEKKTEGKVKVKQKNRYSGFGPRVLHSPHIAEKPSWLAEKNQYVFKVFPRSNKTEIKKAVEEIYGVEVVKVRTVKIPGKKRKVGKIQGRRKGYKKAIVKIKKGQEIEVMPR